MHILLASSSPRRQALLAQLDIRFRVQPPRLDEEAALARLIADGCVATIDAAKRAACTIARLKADDILSALREASRVVQPVAASPDATSSGAAIWLGGPSPDPCVVVAADTMVVCDGKVLNKPTDKQDARRMLTALSGRLHHVVTGLHLQAFSQERPQEDDHRTEASVTQVTFRKLTDGLIDRYIDSGEPVDKAGGYGIQGLGASLVDRIEGCYFNVVGLPIASLCRMLESLGHPVETFWSARG